MNTTDLALAPVIKSAADKGPACRIAIVADWMVTYCGAERVIEELLRLFPEADLYALGVFLDADGRRFLKDRKVHTSILHRLPLGRRIFRYFLPVMPLLIEQFDLSGYDVIISSNHAIAKGVLTRADQLHVSYVHTPIRYAWDLHFDYLQEAKSRWWPKATFTRIILHYMRMWDQLSANRVDVFVANSRTVARRIQRTYRREARVVNPPVDVDAFTLRTDKEDFYVTCSRLVPYKRIDLIVEAFSRMPSRKLVVIGGGPELAKIRAKAGANVTVLGHQPLEVLRDHLQRARAFVFAAEEDFGISPVEAQACGTPVIAFRKGGALETVIDGETGLFFDEQTAESLMEAVHRFESQPDVFDPLTIRTSAERFRAERFQREFLQVLRDARQQFERRDPF